MSKRKTFKVVKILARSIWILIVKWEDLDRIKHTNCDRDTIPQISKLVGAFEKDVDLLD